MLDLRLGLVQAREENAERKMQEIKESQTNKLTKKKIRRKKNEKLREVTS